MGADLHVTVDVSRARRGLPCIQGYQRSSPTEGGLTPAEAAELARDLQTAADFAIGLDGTAPEGAPPEFEIHLADPATGGRIAAEMTQLLGEGHL